MIKYITALVSAALVHAEARRVVLPGRYRLGF